MVRGAPPPSPSKLCKVFSAGELGPDLGFSGVSLGCEAIWDTPLPEGSVCQVGGAGYLAMTYQSSVRGDP